MAVVRCTSPLLTKLPNAGRSAGFAGRATCTDIVLLAAVVTTCWAWGNGFFSNGLSAAEAAPDAGDGVIRYEDHIRPLLRAHCQACHGDDPDTLAGGLDLRTWPGLMQGGESGPAAIASNAAASPLYQRIDAGEMPPAGATPLSPAQRERIRVWIEQGVIATPESMAGVPSQLTAADRAFWSLQPPRLPVLPVDHSAEFRTTNDRSTSSAIASATEPPSNRVDAWIARGLEAQGLSAVPLADRRTQLRRLSYVVRGLPPTFEDVVEFQETAAPLAYEAWVEHYLASPEFGERWARFWLDLTRYADQTPQYLTSAEFAFRYRDWVVNAFNSDLPYDEFIRRQLAADRLPELPLSEQAALGFLGLSPTYWKELKLSPKVIRTVVAEEWDERVDAVTRTFLGLSVSCARCHHHKFDPVTTQDYYALAGVIANSQLVERPLLPAAAAKRVMAARSEIARWQTIYDMSMDKQSAAAREANANIAALQIEAVGLESPRVHGVMDAQLMVLPDGDSRTRLEVLPEQIGDLPVFRRGNPESHGETVPRRFLEVFAAGEPQPFREGSGRKELADAITRDARGLAARVMVNRVWAQVFGTGLVTTPSDFGRQGEPPTHPELLEDLTARFIEHGWSMKWLIRELVTSRTFRQASTAADPAVAGHAATVAAFEQNQLLDPANRGWWRAQRRRLEIEAWRDSLLTATSQLDDRLSGKAEPWADGLSSRRSLYLQVVREDMKDVLRLFDVPDPVNHSPQRELTTTPLQQLYVLNGPLVRETAARLAAQLPAAATMTVATDGISATTGQWTPAITWTYRRIFQRNPDPWEQQLAVDFLTAELHDYRRSPLEAWTLWLRVLLESNEFCTLD